MAMAGAAAAARPGLRAARPEEELDGEQSRQSSTLGAVPLPEVPDFLRRDSMTAENFVIPEPEFTVTETLSKEQSAYGLGSGGEIVYKVWLKFGDMGEWDIFVTRADLSSLISKLKLNSMLAFRPNLGHRLGRHRSVDRPGSNNMLQQQRRQSERRILIPQFSERGLRTASARPLPMTRSSSTPTPSPAAAASPGPPQPTPVGNSDMSDAGHPPAHRGSDASVPGEKHMLLKLTKLLFVPAVGTASRVRKVKAERRRIVQSIFQSILSNEVVRNVAFVKEFLCISTLTFDSRFGVSLKEGWVRVDVHGRERANEKLQWKGKISCCCCICACAPDPQRAKSCLQPRYRRNRWLWAVVKPSFVAFFDKSPNEIDARAADFVLLYSRGYEINKSYSTTGSHRRIMLVGDSLTVRIKFPVRWQKKVWGKAMRAAFEMTSIGTDAFSGDLASNPENALHAGWSDTHQNQSFAPRRYPHEEPGSEMCKAKFHIDGESYFRAVFEAIEAAESQVFIQGWWVSANLPLLRPSRPNDTTKTLAGLVERKAKEGVKISILMYNAVSLALPLDSAFQEKEFRRLEGQANIAVLRHPQHKIKANSTWFWSHHEKLVVVDQKHAFCGGIDLAWGRFDTHAHRLYDSRTRIATDAERDWPGIDFSNVRAHDFEDVANFSRDQHPADCPRMPWHDVHCEYWGAIARDIARHFVHQWNHARFANAEEASVSALVPMDVLPNEYRVLYGEFAVPPELPAHSMLPGNGNFDGDGGHSASPELRARHSGSDSSSSRNVGASHRNGGIANGSNVEDLEPGFAKGLNRTLDDVPEDRMSNATLMESDLEEEEDAILDRNEDASETSQLDEDEEKEEPLPPPPLLTNTVVMSHDDASSEDVGNGDVHGGDDWNRENELPEKPRADSLNHVFDVGAQAIRSLGLWSGSTPGDKERSIEKAMRNLIEDAERFIYIENQFFISGLDADNIVANRVLDTLFKRIVRAHQAKTPFKVIVVIPLLPGFDGYVQESASIRRVLYYEYRCINRGPNSLFQNLLHKGINPDEHIFFCGLRTWETLGGGAPSSSSKADEILGLRQLATELIYVHSKVLIVDDAKCIIGSGNINDRSLAGNRDTEFAVVIEASAKGSNFVRAFRLALMSEHWGVQDSPLDPLWEMLRSPWRDAHFARLVEIAQTNTKAFEDIFPCLPRNDVRDAADLRRYSDSRYVVVDSSNAIEHFLSTRVKGHIVEFPLHFLSQYELRPGIIEDGTGAILGDEVFI